MDFTLKKYQELLVALKEANYSFQTFEWFVQQPKKKAVVLRHDVDRLPENALKMAKLEHENQCSSSYYFRIVPFVFSEDLIKKTGSFGHEVSYHYEDITICKGDVDKAYVHFRQKLAIFRKSFPAKTICMHGSPLTKWDNRDIWKKYNYKDLGIIAEPYFDVDYKKVLYITDTGRKWNKTNISVRDKVDSGFSIQIKSTSDLIYKIRNGLLPDQIIINTHPHRWFDNYYGWTKELIFQNVKNTIKFILVKLK